MRTSRVIFAAMIVALVSGCAASSAHQPWPKAAKRDFYQRCMAEYRGNRSANTETTRSNAQVCGCVTNGMESEFAVPDFEALAYFENDPVTDADQRRFDVIFQCTFIAEK